jgi:hypothetical protein
MYLRVEKSKASAPYGSLFSAALRADFGARIPKFAGVSQHEIRIFIATSLQEQVLRSDCLLGGGAYIT